MENPTFLHLEAVLSKHIEAGVQYAEDTAMEHDDHYRMFRAEDSTAWMTFTLVFVVLIFFDNFIVNRSNKALSMSFACLYTLFWVACACGFCGYIYWRFSSASAFNWMSGYLLEWMLSFDNLFVFHLIFQTYATPDKLKHKPLFWGICGAVFFRLLFLFIGEYMMHTVFFAHILFGAFLIYTGISSVTGDDEEEDPSKNPVVQWLSRQLPFVGAYDSRGAFFVKVALDERGEPILPDMRGWNPLRTNPNHSQSDDTGSSPERQYGTVDFAQVADSQPGARCQWRATMLFLVVVCLEVSDILFAVDSVSAIVAQVPDLFLAYTSAVFAMLGLRAMFFIVDELVKLFSLLKYGVAAVLVFIGAKLILSKMVHVPAGVVCFILFATLFSSMLASVIWEKYQDMSGIRQSDKQREQYSPEVEAFCVTEKFGSRT